MKRVLLLFSCFFSILSFAEVYTVQVHFNNPESAAEYIVWMSEQGEQNLWEWTDVNRPSLSIAPNYDYQNHIIDFMEERVDEE